MFIPHLKTVDHGHGDGRTSESDFVQVDMALTLSIGIVHCCLIDSAEYVRFCVSYEHVRV